MSWMSKGCLVRVGGRAAVVTGEMYTKLVLDDYDRELIAAGMEGGTAMSFVPVIFTDTGERNAFPYHRVTYVAPPPSEIA